MHGGSYNKVQRPAVKELYFEVLIRLNQPILLRIMLSGLLQVQKLTPTNLRNNICQ